MAVTSTAMTDLLEFDILIQRLRAAGGMSGFLEDPEVIPSLVLIDSSDVILSRGRRTRVEGRNYVTAFASFDSRARARGSG